MHHNSPTTVLTSSTPHPSQLTSHTPHPSPPHPSQLTYYTPHPSQLSSSPITTHLLHSLPTTTLLLPSSAITTSPSPPHTTSSLPPHTPSTLPPGSGVELYIYKNVIMCLLLSKTSTINFPMRVDSGPNPSLVQRKLRLVFHKLMKSVSEAPPDHLHGLRLLCKMCICEQEMGPKTHSHKVYIDAFL